MTLQQTDRPTISFFIEDGSDAVPSRLVGMALLSHHSNSEALTDGKPRRRLDGLRSRYIEIGPEPDDQGTLLPAVFGW